MVLRLLLSALYFHRDRDYRQFSLLNKKYVEKAKGDNNNDAEKGGVFGW
jgi:hypothetical protein